MLNLVYLKELMRENRRLWLGCTAVLLLEILLCEALGGTAAEGFLRFLRAVPGGAGHLSNSADVSLTGSIGICMGGALFQLLPASCSALTAVRLGGKNPQDGTTAGLAAVAGSRSDILFTDCYWMAVSLLGTFVCTSAGGWIGSRLWKAGALEIAPYLLLNAGAFCLQLLLGGVLYFLVCLFRKNGFAGTACAVFLAVSYLLFLLADFGNSLPGVYFPSVFLLYQPEKILAGAWETFLELPALAAAGLLLYKAGSLLLERADLTV